MKKNVWPVLFGRMFLQKKVTILSGIFNRQPKRIRMCLDDGFDLRRIASTHGSAEGEPFAPGIFEDHSVSFFASIQAEVQSAHLITA
jgi:hypothetical protein